MKRMSKTKSLADVTTNCYVYEIHAIYFKGYFNNPEHPLNQVLQFASLKPKTIEYMQQYYPHCKLISAQLIKSPS